MNLRPPPTVADVPTFDRWIRESLLSFLKKLAASGGGSGGTGGADNRNIVATGETRVIADGTCSVLSTYVEIEAGGTLEISSTGILDII
jgi:hypothetical protein